MDEGFALRIEAECRTGDIEADHVRADEILLDALRDLGFEKTISAFNATQKWYS